MNPFHRFLIKRRIYCELCDGRCIALNARLCFE